MTPPDILKFFHDDEQDLINSFLIQIFVLRVNSGFIHYEIPSAQEINKVTAKDSEHRALLYKFQRVAMEVQSAKGEGSSLEQSDLFPIEYQFDPSNHVN